MSRYFDEHSAWDDDYASYDNISEYDYPYAHDEYDGPEYNPGREFYDDPEYVDRFKHRFGPSYDTYEEPYYDDIEENMWVDIPGHPNHQINIYGQVRHKRKKNILKPMMDKDGYHRMSLGSVDNVPVHRIMCKTFYGEPQGNKTQVNHRDCNRQNNYILNLEWCTPSENIKWAVSHGNLDPMKGLRRAAEVNPKPVRIVETGQVFCSVKDCAEYLGIKPNSVSRVLVGERKGQRIHGFHIEFVNKEDMR